MNDTHVYLAKCRDCHAVRAFTRDEPKYQQDTLNDIREFLEDGRRYVVRVAWADLPDGIRFGKHTCERAKDFPPNGGTNALREALK